MTLRSVPALATGAVLLTTVIVTDCCAVPPGPVHDSVKVVVTFSAPVDCTPVMLDLAPLQLAFAGVALAVHDAAFWTVQFKVELPPAASVVSVAPNWIVGSGSVTVTAAFAFAVPPGPVQASVNVVLATRTAETSLPLVALVPVQPPLAVQVVALVEFQARFVDKPVVTDTGIAVSVTVGATGAVTVTDVLADPEPPVPEHVSVKLALAASAAEVSVPLVAFAPVQPPEAVHEVALVLDQVSAVVAPEVTLAGLADRVTVGAATGAGVEPPPPPQAARTRDETTGAA